MHSSVGPVANNLAPIDLASVEPAPSRRWPVFVTVGIVAVIALWLGLAALATPFDHDESQYVAGAFFARHLAIYRDFAYLQPPLHAFAYAPIAALLPAHMMATMRLATAASAGATLALIWAALRAAGISPRIAGTATILMAATASFQFTAAVVRNDMLPTLLLAGAMLLAIRTLRDGRYALWLATGLCLGLAISCKLNFAPVAAMVGLFLLCRRSSSGFKAAVLLAIGGAIGMAPMLWAFAGGADGFVYGVLTYGMTAPHAWYAANGAGGELSVSGKVGQFLLNLARGPALVSLLLLATGVRRREAWPPARRLAIWMVAGALTGAALPSPTQLQYLMPLLPPLALALGYGLEHACDWNAGRRRVLAGLLGISALLGIFPAAAYIARLATSASAVLSADAAARRAGDLVRQAGAHGALVTLAPHMMASSGLPIDPRFATGPFIYRTGWTVPVAFARHIGAMVPQALSDLDRSRPAAILTGYEGGTRNLPIAPDAGLIGYARRHRYRAVAMPDGRGTLYLRATASASPANAQGRRPQSH